MQAQQFLEAVTSHQQKLDKSQTSDQSTNKSIENDKQKEPLTNLFKAAAGSWECKMCYVRNDGSNLKCIACDTPAPGNAVETKYSVPVSQNQNTSSQMKPLSEVFKPAVGSWTCQSCYMINNASDMSCPACNGPNPSAPPKPVSRIQSSTLQGKSLSEMFKPAAGSWTCQGCYMVNKGSDSYCPACDAPKDPSMPPKPKASIFDTSKESSSSTPTFTFGIPQNNKEPSSGSGFPFSVSNTSNKPQDAGDANKSSISTIFGGPKKSECISTNFTFGIQERPTTPPNVKGPYVFGSPGKSFDFQFNAKASVKSPGGGETSEDEVVESDDIYFAPVIPLPDKVEVKTGEEDEEVVYSHRAKLFRFDSNSKEWKERGLGDIKLLRHRQTQKLRLVMRRDQILKLCLNHAMTSDIEISSKDDKTWLWSAADYSEGEIEYSQFACRFKTLEIAREFKSAIDSALKGEVPSNQLDKLKINEKVDIPSKTPSQDVEIIYEVKVTPEEKEAAKKLQLPENFYAYKFKEDCPGCIGCKEPSQSLFDVKPVDKVVKTIDFSKSDSLVSQKLAENVANVSKTSAPISTSTSQPVFSFMGSANKPSTGLFGTPKTSPVTVNKSETSVFNDKPATSYVFGSSFTQPADEKKTESSIFKKPELNVENLKICSPTMKLPTSTVASTFSFANAPKSATPSFGSTLPSHGNEKSVFSGSPSTNAPSIFGGKIFGTAQKDSDTFSTTAASSVKTSSIFGGFSQSTPTTTAPVFGSQPETLSTATSKSTSTSGTVTSSGFGTTSNVFGGTPTIFSTGSFGTGGTNNVFGNSTGNIFGAKKTDDSSDKVSFLPTDNAISFSTLAAKGDQKPNFKVGK